MCHESVPAPISGGAGIIEQPVELPGAERAIPAFFARPEGEAAPAVLIVHDVWGANDFYHDLARRLAGEGFATLLPDLFVREGGLPEQTREAAFARRAKMSQTRALDDIAGAMQWLAKHEATTGKVGTVGFCMGGTLVMLAAARDPLADATVAYYGFPAGQKTELAPLVPLDEPDRLRSPLLAFWGDQDQGVGMENVEAYRAALHAANVVHEFVIYAGLGHGFLTFDPDAPAYEGAKDSVDRMLACFRERLGP